MSIVYKRKGLRSLAKQLGVRKDWHEPDEQQVTVEVRGNRFDNAGCWGREDEARQLAQSVQNRWNPNVEMYVIVSKNDQPIAEVNLADLFAWACGYDDTDLTKR